MSVSTVFSQRATAYWLAICLPFLALALRLAIPIPIQEHVFLILFVFPIIVSSWVGGMWPGLLTTALVELCAAWVLPPSDSFAMGSTHEWLHWGILLVNGVLISTLSELSHHARRREQIQMRQVQQALHLVQQTAEQAQRVAMDLREAQRGANIGNWHWDLSSNTCHWSPEIYALLERDPTLPAIAHPELLAYFTPDSRVQFNAAAQQILRDGEPLSCDLEGVSHEGVSRWVAVRWAAKRDDAGKIVELYGTVQDITARKQAEQTLWQTQQAALEEQRQAHLSALALMEDAIAARERAEAARLALQASEAQYRLLAENSAECIFWMDAEQRFKYVSPAAYSLFGLTSEALLAQANLLIERIHPADRPRYQRHLTECLHATCLEHDELDFRVCLPDGQEKWIGHFCQPIFDTHGQYQGCSGMNRDITSRKQAEAKRDVFSAALRQSVQPLLLMDMETCITFLNPAFMRLFGYASADLLGKPVICLAPPTAHDEYQAVLDTVRHKGEWTGEMACLTQTGVAIPTAASMGTILDPQGKPIGFVGSYLDLRPLHEKEQMLRKLSLAVEQSPESIAITNLEAEIEYVNEAFTRISGYSREELLGRNPRSLQSGKTSAQTYQTLWQTLLSGETWQGEFYNRRKDGTEYVEQATISPLRQPSGEITHYVAIKEDITDKKHNEAELHRLAFYDPLTGLPNRTLLLERIGLALSKHDQGALLALNIDRFKNINDAAGQALGDRLLQAVAERLHHRLIQHPCVVARIAGDEFCILLLQLSAEKHQAIREVHVIAAQIQTYLRAAFAFGDEHFDLTACLGITLFPDTVSDTPLDVLRRANTALHHSKRKGLGQTTFFDEGLDELAKQRFTVEHELHQAIVAGDLRLYLQSQVDAEGRVVGAETLVRWQHPQRGMIAPAEFIPIAEESNLVVEISTWVFDAVCRLLNHPALRERDLRLAVNISPRHFRQPDFVSQIQRGLTDSGANPSHLTLEITEGLVLDNLQDVVAKMRELGALGIHFSMDDFGTGYSSLSYLKRLPINELKIDKTFVQDMTHDANDAALVEVILSVARHMGLTVVAEGVETAEQAAFLNQRGKVIHQGYLFSRPEPVEVWLANLPPTS